MASSLGKIASSRANGAKSHGPVTPAGLQISALNSFVHGLTSKSVELCSESETRFQLLFESYVHHFKPVGDVEMDFIQEMAVAKWQERRGGW